MFAGKPIDLIAERRGTLKISDIEILELQNIPVTPPLFKGPVRAAVRVLKVKTDDGPNLKSAVSCFRLLLLSFKTTWRPC